MKICPACNQRYADDTLNFCLTDGVGLQEGVAGEQQTLILNKPQSTSPNQQFGTQANQPGLSAPGQYGIAPPRRKSYAWLWVLLILGGLFLLCGGGFVALIALMPMSEDHVFTTDDIFNDSPTPPPTKVEPAETGDGKVTKANFDKLKNGMSYKQVAEILGEGEEITKSDSSSAYMWQTDDFGMVMAFFMNDKLFSKSQSGLK